MKNIIKVILTVLLITSHQSLITTLNAQVGINDNNASPDASAMLDVKSNTKGMLIPRMTTTERDNINSPATGLMVYNTTTNAFNYYNGTAWTVVGQDNLGDHTATANIQLNGKYLSNDGNNKGISMDNHGSVFINSSAYRTLYAKNNNYSSYLEVNNAYNTRALFGVDGSGFDGGPTTDVIAANWSNGALKFYTNATQRIHISKDGLVNIKDTLKITDGSQGMGKVLTSDANGVATWANPTTNTDNQNLDVAQLNGTNLELSLSNDGQATKTIDLSSLNQTKALIADADNDTKIQVEESADEDKIRFDIKSKEQMYMELNGTGNYSRLTFNQSHNIFIGNGAGNAINTSGFGHNVLIGTNAGLHTNYGYSTIIGTFAGENNTSGYNTFLGYDAGRNSNGSGNVFVGDNTGFSASGLSSTFLGSSAGLYGGNYNVYLGSEAGTGLGTNNNNIFIGYQAGRYFTSGTSNKLIIENSNSNTPLIYGEFDNNLVQINGSLKVVDGSQDTGKVLVSDANGTATWSKISSEAIEVPDTAQPIPIKYHGGYIYVHPTDNGAATDWATAKTTCENLTAFGKSDWYLPTRLELDAMYKQSYLITGLSQTEIIKYWSNTVKDATYAFTQRLDYGGPDPDAKTNTSGHNCRCVRKN